MQGELQRYHRLFRYDAWANGETLASLRAVAPPPAVRWMAHIVGAETLWLARLTGEPATLAVWPDLSLDAIALHLERLQGAWPAYLATLETDELAEGVGYRNTQGEFWTSTVEDILMQVFTHSAYHRGQIAAAVRAAGGTPAMTDYIHAARRGLVE